MGELGDDADTDKLDERMWGSDDDDEEQEQEEREKKEEKGAGVDPVRKFTSSLTKQ